MLEQLKQKRQLCRDPAHHMWKATGRALVTLSLLLLRERREPNLWSHVVRTGMASTVTLQGCYDHNGPLRRRNCPTSSRYRMEPATVSNYPSSKLPLIFRINNKHRATMSHRSTKRPAHFEEERDSPKRSRGDANPHEGRDYRRDRNQGREQAHRRRSRSRSVDRERRNGDQDRRERKQEGVKDGRDRQPNARRERSPPKPGRASNQSREKQHRDNGSNGHGQPTSSSKAVSKSNALSTVPAVPTMKPAQNVDDRMDVDPIEATDDEADAEMRKIMGFTKFRSTKETKVPGNDKLYAVRKEKKTEYRQYMNRVGGFNRPLSPSYVFG